MMMGKNGQTKFNETKSLGSSTLNSMSMQATVQCILVAENRILRDQAQILNCIKINPGYSMHPTCLITSGNSSKHTKLSSFCLQTIRHVGPGAS